ncbi:MAG: CvpA family protein [Verrucomicrobiota bacterium]|nr:CvpA family protein [Verrucomicrobiota bacterium]|tara:strand:- start:3120 stop:3989 length:870 start_codon:yes stop_codon:yes gene_type:complete
MALAFDIICFILFLFFLYKGSKEGLIVSIFKILQIILAISISFLIGIKIGSFLGETFNRPRIVTIPAVIILMISTIFYLFHIFINFFLEKSKSNKNSFSGLGIIFGGIFGFIIIISTCWFINIFAAVKYENHTFINKTYTSKISQKTIYEVTNNIYSFSNSSINESTAKIISSPNSTILSVKKIISSNLIQNIIEDPEIGEIIKTGSPKQILQNESMKELFSNKIIINEFKNLGITKKILLNSIIKIGQNKLIMNSLINLKSKDLFNFNNFNLLIRDPDFDCIIGELIK